MSDIFKEVNFKINDKNVCDGIYFTRNIRDEVVSVAFFDPQYRGVLDKMKYGQCRMKDRRELKQMGEEEITLFVQEINRVLKKSGYLFLWVDKFHLTNDVENFREWMKGTDFTVVDMITWDKNKLGMGYRTRRISEYCLVLQKKPTKAKTTWTDHSIPDVWLEKTKKVHPHSKPVELQKRLILATTHEGDVVLDPASGGYTILEICKEINRTFVGCDIKGDDKDDGSTID